MYEHEEIQEAVVSFEQKLEAIFRRRHNGADHTKMTVFVLKGMATCFGYHAACALTPDSKEVLLKLLANELDFSFRVCEEIKKGDLQHEQNS